MDEKIVFLSDGKINIFQENKVTELNSSMVEGYMQKIKEIRAKSEWKKSGTGAKFMGMNFSGMEDYELSDEKLHINGIAGCGNDSIVYSLNTGSVGGVYIKDLLNQNEPERYILVKEKMRFHDVAVNTEGRIIVSVSDTYLESHLALLNLDNSDFIILTEGESYDSNPTWSKNDENIVYYDSCGLGYGGNGNFMRYGPKSVYRLNVKNGDLTEALTGDKFDFYSPYEDESGNLFYIKRPYSYGINQRMSLKDILLIPVKILKAIFGWLNFFTQRYSGESLKTTGNNPAKAPQKSPEQVFIDGNLLEAEKNLNQNKARGEKNPGYAPYNWELMVKKSNGDEKVLKKGVLSYCVLSDNSILYSNGKYIIRLYETGKEEIVAKAHLAHSLIN